MVGRGIPSRVTINPQHLRSASDSLDRVVSAGEIPKQKTNKKHTHTQNVGTKTKVKLEFSMKFFSCNLCH